LSKIDPTENATASQNTSIRGARLLVVLLALAWGMNWPMSRLTLMELPPWGTRFLSLGLGMVVLFIAVLASRRRLRIQPMEWIHVTVAGFFNVAAFNILNIEAIASGNASRAVVIAYSMPIWAALMAWLTIGEVFDRIRVLALALCAAGLVILIWPLASHGLPVSALLSLGCALVWAVGTVYMKWAVVDADAITITAWQLLVGWVLIGAGMLIFEGPPPDVTALHATTIGALIYNGLIGFGLAYSLWFTIIGRLPAMTASLGSLLVPVVGIMASAAVLGERPTLTDYVGFALIFAAAACVLLRPNMRHTELPE
jgi:drug/metabolite transporter (DMT)-like permease